MRKAVLYLLSIALLSMVACNETVVPKTVRKEKPVLFPDYVGVTVPATIAPLNFKVQGEYQAIDALLEGKNNQIIHVQDKDFVHIDPVKWARLLNESKGDSLRITVSVKQADGWVQFAPFAVHVSDVPIDYGLVYRLIAPGYEVYSKMGIYQRDMSSFTQTPILENTLIPGSCINCHSFRLANPDDMSLHIRGQKGGTILKTSGTVKLLNTKTKQTISNFVYPFWHPSGKYMAYSVNNTHQVFHEAKGERVEVGDAASDVIVYDIAKNEAIGSPVLMQDSVFETLPTFSPDGRSLYFCAAKAKKMPVEYKEVKYNLCRVLFDPETGTIGNTIDTLFNATAIGKSVAFPRPSPDGKYIMFTLIDYGNFSIWHKEADLYLLDVRTGECRPVSEANSDQTESYHSWSSNSRWFVFSSRRIDGLYTRPFIAFLDENGKAGKPFLLPQADPDYYERLLFSFNVPEFVSAPVDLNTSTIERLMATPGENVGFRK